MNLSPIILISLIVQLAFWMRRIGVGTSICITMILIGILLFTTSGNGQGSSVDKKALIIVSGNGGYSQNELDKASSFMEYLLEDLEEEEIICLTDPNDYSSDGPANLSNIEDAFYWLEVECDSGTEVIIYISDHINSINNNRTFIFDDGNITTVTLDNWLDEISFSEMTIILNGERSGLGGPDLADSGRSVICSMREYQFFDPDRFDITISLENPLLDQDLDGEISFIEAFFGEVLRLQPYNQSPIMYEG